MSIDLAALRRFLGSRRQAQVEFLAALVRLRSDNPPGDLAGDAEAAAGLLEGLGLTVERHPVPAEAAEAAGLRSATNLIVRHRFGAGPTVALNAHGDAVPAGAGWRHPPHGAAVEDGTMYGRGVAVSKSDFATYAFALLALIAEGRALAGAVDLHFTYDEESGGMAGPRRLLAERLSRPDFAICPGFAHAVVIGHNGCLHLEVTLRGKQAHAAFPETGRDALEAAASVLAALYAARASFAARRSGVAGIGSPSLVVGRIEGGVNTNVVPDLVRLRLDRRLIPEEDPAAAEAELRQWIGAAAAAHAGIEVGIGRLLLARPLLPSAASERLGRHVAAAAGEVLGRPVPLKGVPLYTDARHYAEAGIPTVLYGAGPAEIGEANAHAAEECLRLADLETATLAVALAVGRLLTPA
jgi:acetylornithine deacetylase/succinyl-diaminopimelate desuccinylase-like protein